MGEQGVTVHEMAQGSGLAVQIADHVLKIDAVSSPRTPDTNSGCGHHLIRSEKEIDAIVEQVGVETPTDEPKTAQNR